MEENKTKLEKKLDELVEKADKMESEREAKEKIEKIAKFRHEIEVLTYYLGGPLTEEEKTNVEDRVVQLKAELVYMQQGHTKEAEQVVNEGKTKEVALQSKIQRAGQKMEEAKQAYDNLIQQAQNFQEKRAKKIAQALAKEYIG